MSYPNVATWDLAEILYISTPALSVLGQDNLPFEIRRQSIN